MDILEEFWYGNLSPSDQNSPVGEYKRWKEQSIRKFSELETMLNEQERQILREFQDSLMQMQVLSECNAFTTGFRMGVKFMVSSIGRD